MTDSSTLRIAATSECHVPVFSVAVGTPDERSVPLYSAPPQSQPLTDEQIDAARYRWLRENINGERWELLFDDLGRDPLDMEALDAAIDAAMLAACPTPNGCRNNGCHGACLPPPEHVADPLTMDAMYGDGSDHPACPKCGYCAQCGDCQTYGCGATPPEAV